MPAAAPGNKPGNSGAPGHVAHEAGPFNGKGPAAAPYRFALDARLSPKVTVGHKI